MSKINSKRQTCAYLYGDGHAVILFEQRVKIGGSYQDIEYAVVHEKFTEAHLGFKGRICFSRYESQALMDLCKRAAVIRASEPSVESGSENTRKLGLAVGSLSFDFANGGNLHFTSIPGLICSSYTYQPEHTDMFNADGNQTWGLTKIAQVIRAKQNKPAIAQAA